MYNIQHTHKHKNQIAHMHASLHTTDAHTYFMRVHKHKTLAIQHKHVYPHTHTCFFMNELAGTGSFGHSLIFFLIIISLQRR